MSGARQALFVAVVVLAASPSPAQDAPAREERKSENPFTSAPPAETPAPAGVLTKAPELLQFIEAAYPKDAEGKRLEGAVGLLVDIDESGAVSKVEVAESAGNGFDEAAVAAVKQFRFSPAEIDHKPSAVRISYRYSFVLAPEPAPEKNARESLVNFRGRLLTRGSREVVRNASVAVDSGATGCQSDDEGRFEIQDLAKGRHPVSVTASGYDRFETEEEIVEGKITEVTYYVRKRVFTPYETVVKGQRERKDVARVELKQEEIRLIPGTQGDALKVVQNLPGVTRAPFGFGVLLIRGGRPFDSRVYLDGVWIPLLFHFGGLTSVFNSDLLSDIAFYPGNFGVHDGRAIAGVVEAKTRSPSKEGYHGYGNVNVIDSTALVEGPITDTLSVAVSARRSYVDLVLKAVLPEDVGFGFIVAPRYYDYQAKIEYAPKGSSRRFRFLLFGSNDEARLLLDNPALVDPEGRGDIGFAIGFHRAVASMSASFTENLRTEMTLAIGFEDFHSAIGGDIRSDAYITTAQLRTGFTYDLCPSLTLDAGTDSFLGSARYEVASPPIPLPNQVPDPIASRQLRRETNRQTLAQPGLYADAVWRPFSGTRIVPGFRVDHEKLLGYTTFDPRLSVFHKPAEATTLKGGVGLYHQAPDFRAGQWTEGFGNPRLRAEESIQYMVGVEHRFTESIGVDFQVYYKDLRDQLQPSSAVVERDGKQVLERWNNGGVGRSYGAEILLRHDLTASFFGWIAYTLSRTERKDVFNREGGYRLSLLDQPHNLIVVASYKWPDDWVSGARFRFTSGNPQTPILSSVYDADGDLFFPIPGKPASLRGPSFLSLDIRVDKRFVFKTWSLAIFLDVQNVTNNENVENVTYNYDFSKTRNLTGLPILPSLGLKAEF
jgi:TonB family protein